MTNPEVPMPSPVVRFPNFTELGDLNSFSVIVQDLSLIYDVTAVAVLPGYERVRMPWTRLGPRRASPLRQDDRLLVKSVSLSSPLVIVFDIIPYLAAIGIGSESITRLATAVKSWIDVLTAGVDLQQRKQALEQNRTLAPYQLEAAQLRNALLEQKLRHVGAPPGSELVERARMGMLDVQPASELEVSPFDELDDSELGEPRRSRFSSYKRSAGSMTSQDFAELLDEPVDRLLGYAGGEMEVAGDDSGLS